MPPIGRARKKKSKRLKHLALLQLLTGQRTETVLSIFAVQKARKLVQHIPRGPYASVHSDDFIFVLLRDASERRFKALMRQVFFL